MKVSFFPTSVEPFRQHHNGMLAAKITAPRRTQLASLSRPVPGPGEVLIRLEGCGMCASTLPKWQGREWFDYPLYPGDPGHEGFGEVEEVGEGVENLKKGDRVAALSYRALAEFDLASANETVLLPAALKHAIFPGEPLACLFNIFDRADIQPGQTVAVIGIGFLGSLLVELAKKRGARVIAISRRPFSLELARSRNADYSWSSQSVHELLGRAGELTEGALCDRVIEASGKQESLDLAAELTGFGGKLVIAGYHQDGLRQVNMQLWNWRAFDVVNAHERDPQKYVQGMKKAVNAVANCEIDIAPLLTHFFFPDQVDQAFQALEQRPEGFIKGIVRF